jgi:hypothetical protein
MPDQDGSNRAFKELLFLQWLIDECGMSHPKPIKGGRQPRYAAILPKLFTHAIVVAPMHDRYSIDDNYCYQGYAKAKAALDAWDGTGEPTGWLRHPLSGRRISQSPDEIDEDGNRVGAVGVMYRRG